MLFTIVLAFSIVHNYAIISAIRSINPIAIADTIRLFESLIELLYLSSIVLAFLVSEFFSFRINSIIIIIIVF